jgi:hypothetical protein
MPAIANPTGFASATEDSSSPTELEASLATAVLLLFTTNADGFFVVVVGDLVVDGGLAVDVDSTPSSPTG